MAKIPISSTVMMSSWTRLVFPRTAPKEIRTVAVLKSALIILFEGRRNMRPVANHKEKERDRSINIYDINNLNNLLGIFIIIIFLSWFYHTSFDSVEKVMLLIMSISIEALLGFLLARPYLGQFRAKQIKVF